MEKKESFWVPESEIRQSSLRRQARIVRKKNKWCVESEKGRNMGCYDTKEEAKKRLRQVEYFKHKKGASSDLKVGDRVVPDPSADEIADDHVNGIVKSVKGDYAVVEWEDGEITTTWQGDLVRIGKA